MHFSVNEVKHKEKSFSAIVVITCQALFSERDTKKSPKNIKNKIKNYIIEKVKINVYLNCLTLTAIAFRLLFYRLLPENLRKKKVKIRLTHHKDRVHIRFYFVLLLISL